MNEEMYNEEYAEETFESSLPCPVTEEMTDDDPELEDYAQKTGYLVKGASWCLVIPVIAAAILFKFTLKAMTKGRSYDMDSDLIEFLIPSAMSILEAAGMILGGVLIYRFATYMGRFAVSEMQKNSLLILAGIFGLAGVVDLITIPLEEEPAAIGLIMSVVLAAGLIYAGLMSRRMNAPKPGNTMIASAAVIVITAVTGLAIEGWGEDAYEESDYIIYMFSALAVALIYVGSLSLVFGSVGKYLGYNPKKKED